MWKQGRGYPCTDCGSGPLAPFMLSPIRRPGLLFLGNSAPPSTPLTGQGWCLHVAPLDIHNGQRPTRPPDGPRPREGAGAAAATRTRHRRPRWLRLLLLWRWRRQGGLASVARRRAGRALRSSGSRRFRGGLRSSHSAGTCAGPCVWPRRHSCQRGGRVGAALEQRGGGGHSGLWTGDRRRGNEGGGVCAAASEVIRLAPPTQAPSSSFPGTPHASAVCPPGTPPALVLPVRPAHAAPARCRCRCGPRESLPPGPPGAS